jgi:hypothetical protein
LTLEYNVVVVVYLPNVSITTGDVLGQYLTSPEYLAWIECWPAVNAELVSTAIP